MLSHTGPARVFDSEEDAIEAIYTGKIVDGDVVVIRYEGPKGGPGMREMLNPTSALAGMKLDKTVALITDGRFSGASRGALHRTRLPGSCCRAATSVCCRKATSSRSTSRTPESTLRFLTRNSMHAARITWLRHPRQPAAGWQDTSATFPHPAKARSWNKGSLKSLRHKDFGMRPADSAC